MPTIKMVPKGWFWGLIVMVALLLGKIDARQGGQRYLQEIRAVSRSTTRGDGSATSVSKASTEVIKEETDALSESIAEAVDAAASGDMNASASAHASAEAIGSAFIRITTNAAAVVSATGEESEACSNASASGETVATAIAEAIATGFAKAKTDVEQSIADGVAEAVKNATIKVSASALAEACVTQGQANATQIVVAEGYLEVVAEAFVDSLAIISGENGTADSTSDSSGSTIFQPNVTSTDSASIDGEGTVTTMGVGSAEVISCPEPQNQCCKHTTFSVCSCGKFTNGERCLLRRDESETGTVWESENGDKCSC